MGVPWYISNKIKSFLLSLDRRDNDSLLNMFGDTGFMTFMDEQTDTPHVCGIITLQYNNKELPVVIIEGYVFDVVNRIYNRRFDNYYVLTGAIGINTEKSRYLLTQPMLQFFIENNISFLRDGRNLKDLNDNKITRWNSCELDKCWLIS